MNVSATGIPVLWTNARERAGGVTRGSRRCRRARSGSRRRRSISRPRAGAPCRPGSGWTGAWRGSGEASSGRGITSSGSSRWVAPGFSDSATLNALRTTSGMISGLETRAFHLTIGRMMPMRSMYWCDSLCMRSRSDCPVRATRGARSRNASATAVTRFVAPGPRVPRQTPARPVSRPIGVGHIRPALLVADGNELDRRVGQRLVQIERLLARNAEHVPNPFRLQALDEHFRSFARSYHDPI